MYTNCPTEWLSHFWIFEMNKELLRVIQIETPNPTSIMINNYQE